MNQLSMNERRTSDGCLNSADRFGMRASECLPRHTAAVCEITLTTSGCNDEYLSSLS